MNLTDLLKFIFTYFNVANTGDTTDNKGQCVGLIEVWIDALGLTHDWGNAKDLLTNADTSKFDVIQNTPDGFPQSGDILVYGSQWGGGYGHTGVVVWADANKILLYEQNNPGAPTIKLEGYDDCVGWLHPKNFTLTSGIAPSVLDTANQRADNNYNQLQTTLHENSDLNAKITDLQTQLQNLRDAFDAQTKADADTGAQLLDAQHNATNLQNEVRSIAGALSTPTDLPSILKAIDTLKTPLDEQVKPLQQQALSLQQALDELIYKRVPKDFWSKLWTKIKSWRML